MMCCGLFVAAVESDVWPLFGPRGGGTLITVTGSNLTEPLKQPAEIAFFSSNSHDIITLSTNVVTHKYETTVLRMAVVRMIVSVLSWSVVIVNIVELRRNSITLCRSQTWSQTWFPICRRQVRAISTCRDSSNLSATTFATRFVTRAGLRLSTLL